MKEKDNKPSLFDEFRKPSGKLDLEALAKYLLNAHGGTEFFIISKWTQEGKIQEQYGIPFGQLVVELFSIIFRANFGDGDKLAQLQLKAIEKLAHPETYELTITDIEKIAAKDLARPSIARAMELRSIMTSLAWVVCPAKGEHCEPNQPVKLKSSTPPKHLEETHRLAIKHWHSGTTLQALAIRVYLAQLQDEGVLDAEDEGINEDSLKDDLAEARRWEVAHLDVRHWQGLSLNETPIRVYEYSQRWKQMRVKRNERKKGGKKSKNLG